MYLQDNIPFISKTQRGFTSQNERRTTTWIFFKPIAACSEGFRSSFCGLGPQPVMFFACTETKSFFPSAWLCQNLIHTQRRLQICVTIEVKRVSTVRISFYPAKATYWLFRSSRKLSQGFVVTSICNKAPITISDQPANDEAFCRRSLTVKFNSISLGRVSEEDGASEG